MQRSLTLDQKLGLLVAAVLSLGIASITTISYLEMRSAAVDGTGRRLGEVARQLAELFEQSGRARLAVLRQTASDLRVLAFLERGGGDTTEVVQVLKSAVPERTATAELWDAAGRRLLQVGVDRPPLDDPTVQRLRGYTTFERTTAVGPLKVNVDTVRYALLAAATVGNRVAGYVVHRQPIATAAAARDQFSRLLGTGSRVFLGNVDGDVWTDLSERVAAPPVASLATLASDTTLLEYTRPGTSGQFASARRIAGTPWLVVVEFPLELVLRRTRAFLLRGGLTATALIGLVGLVGWRYVRRMTLPVEGALVASEARFQSIVEGTPNGVLMIDGGGRIALVNAAVEALFGFRRDELVGAPVRRLLPEQTRDGREQSIAPYLRDSAGNGAGPGRDVVGLRKDGTEFPLQVGFKPIERDGARFTIASLVDMTAHQAAERELRRSNDELQRFAYVASHDLQEPLRTVASYVQLLERRYKDRLDDDGREFIGYAVDGARRMQRLIEDLLALSRVGSAGLVLVPTSVDRALDGALAGLQLSLEESRAEISRQPLPTVRADARQLEQLFSNLVGNAVKFAGGTPPRIDISARSEGHQWVFEVRDQGIGIEPQYFDRIFVMFQRLHARDEYAGTGIGLAIAKKIVERHGGRIWVESSPGAGTAFRFTLPAIQEA